MILLWCARVAWAVLPVTTGTAFADAVDGWSAAPARVAAVLLWVVWAAGLLALFVPRPWGLTLLRVVAPCAVLAALSTAFAAGGAAAGAAIATSIAAAALALSNPYATAAANAAAYGEERRIPLRIPTPLLLGPLPLAIVVCGGAISAGPIVLAAGHVVLGALLLVIGWPLAFVVARAIHALSMRWLVFVPAGIAVVDPLTLVDPALVRREHIASLRRLTASKLTGNALDLRLGTLSGSIAIDLREPVAFVRRRNRTNAEVLEPATVALALTRAGDALELAGARRIATA